MTRVVSSGRQVSANRSSFSSLIVDKLRNAYWALRTPPARILLFGAQGSGKGTLGKLLAPVVKGPHISTGEAFREEKDADTDLGRLVAPYLDTGELAPDHVTVQFIEGRLKAPDCRRSFILDGFPRNRLQVDMFEEVLCQRGINLTAAIELTGPEDLLISRIQKRGRLDDLDPEVVRKRLRIYYEKTAPLTNFYASKGLLIKVDGVGTAEEVLDRVIKAAKLKRW